MSTTMYGEKTRLISTGDPFKGDDMIVEVLEEGDWKRVWSCNSISNDYAHTESVSMARSWMASMAKVTA